MLARRPDRQMAAEPTADSDHRLRDNGSGPFREARYRGGMRVAPVKG